MFISKYLKAVMKALWCRMLLRNVDSGYCLAIKRMGYDKYWVSISKVVLVDLDSIGNDRYIVKNNFMFDKFDLTYTSDYKFNVNELTKILSITQLKYLVKTLSNDKDARLKYLSTYGIECCHEKVIEIKSHICKPMYVKEQIKILGKSNVGKNS